MSYPEKESPPKHDNHNHPSAASHHRTERNSLDQLEDISPHLVSNLNRINQTHKQPKAPE